jgi:glycosyltransferase involved in cell wall biosynthesis
MRIAIDYTSAVRQSAGIGRYTRDLVSAVTRLDQRNQYVLLVAGGGSQPPSLFPTAANVAYRQVPASDRALAILWHRLRLPLFADAWAGGADVFHSPDFTLPPLWRARGILTVHDLTFMHYPEYAQPGLVTYLNAAVPRSIRTARLVLADSESTKRDILDLLGTPPGKVRVAYAGVGPEFAPVSDAGVLNEVRARYGLAWPFVLSVGTLEPRKNHLRLIRSFAQILPAYPDLRLVLVGGKGWLYQDVKAEVARLALRERVVFPGFVTDADLPALYSLASVFAYPSLYEGFGLPVLEAMACGTPVVCSNASSLPEVAGDAALLVDPTDGGALARALDQALTDQPMRQVLRTRGQAQAARFTWSDAAGTLLDAYHEAATLSQDTAMAGGRAANGRTGDAP